MKNLVERPVIVAILVSIMLALSVSFASASGGEGAYHTVHRGETLFSIGRRYGVNPYMIANANGLANPDHIYAGQVLYIPEGNGSWGNDNRDDDCRSGRNCNSWDNKNRSDNTWRRIDHRRGDGSNYHTVRRGENLFRIGLRYGVSYWTIADANGIRNPNRIYAGEVLYIPSGHSYY